MRGVYISKHYTNVTQKKVFIYKRIQRYNNWREYRDMYSLKTV